jgi:hypothetical protein
MTLIIAVLRQLYFPPTQAFVILDEKEKTPYLGYLRFKTDGTYRSFLFLSLSSSMNGF